MRARRRAPAPAPVAAATAAAASAAAASASAAADAPAPAADTAAASAAAAAPVAARPDHTRFDYMKHNDVLSAARRQRQLARQRSWEKFRACAKLAALRARASTWRERARRAAGCGELRKLLDEITLAYQRGHFKVRTHVLCVMELRFLPCAPRLAPSSSDRKIRRALFRMASSASATATTSRAPRWQRHVTSSPRHFDRASGPCSTSSRTWCTPLQPSRTRTRAVSRFIGTR